LAFNVIIKLHYIIVYYLHTIKNQLNVIKHFYSCYCCFIALLSCAIARGRKYNTLLTNFVGDGDEHCVHNSFEADMSSNHQRMTLNSNNRQGTSKSQNKEGGYSKIDEPYAIIKQHNNLCPSSSYVLKLPKYVILFSICY
jgi:hypothetical protein